MGGGSGRYRKFGKSKKANQVKQASYLSDYVQLAKGVSPVDVETLAMVSKQSRLLIRP